MPPKEVTLVDLCLENIAANVLRHGKKFTEVPPGCKVYLDYKTAQFFCTDRIVEAVQNIFRAEVENNPKNRAYVQGLFSRGTFSEITAFLFLGRMCNNENILWPALQLLFNEHTSNFEISFPRYYAHALKELPELFFDALSLCTNLKSLKFHFCSVSKQQLRKFSGWHSLVELDLLLGSCTDSIIMRAFKKCPNLHTLKATGRGITNLCLFNLCKNNPKNTQDNFQLCKSEGMCCDLGKRLKKLVLYGTEITKFGIACALQHLTSMEEFLDGPLYKMTDSPNQHLLPSGIHELRKAYILQQRACPKLKLTTMIYDTFAIQNILSEIDECCPYIHRRVFCEERRLSYLRCQKTSTLGLTNVHYPELQISMSAITSSLEIEPVKHFLMTTSYNFFICETMDEPDPPLNTKYLEHIDLASIFFLESTYYSFFTKLLCEAVNVKSLILTNFTAETCLMSAMEKNKFKSLEEISIWRADLSKILLESIIRQRASLRKITYCHCNNEEIFVKRHKDFSRKYNFPLDIYLERDICTATLIKFKLI